VVSRAFQVLSDPEKKAKFDQFGGDPDNRFGPGAASSPFGNGFAHSPGTRNPMFDDELSPEELFNRFFGGGMGGVFAGMFERRLRFFGTTPYDYLQEAIPLAAAHSSSSTWGVDQGFEYISLAAYIHGGGQGLPPRRGSAHHPCSRFSRISLLSSYYSFSRS
jgi:curved DNA-binding protein CbpA